MARDGLAGLIAVGAGLAAGELAAAAVSSVNANAIEAWPMWIMAAAGLYLVVRR